MLQDRKTKVGRRRWEDEGGRMGARSDQGLKSDIGKGREKLELN
jgi:hypothetical protein